MISTLFITQISKANRFSKLLFSGQVIEAKSRNGF